MDNVRSRVLIQVWNRIKKNMIKISLNNAIPIGLEVSQVDKNTNPCLNQQFRL